MNIPIIKCAIIGDSTVGKTTLINKLNDGQFLGDYIQTTIDTIKVIHSYNNIKVQFKFLDLAGQHGFKDVRKYWYDVTGIDIFILTFAIDDMTSFKNIDQFWLPEIKNTKLCNKPIILIGTKSDCKGKDNMNLVEYNTALNYAIRSNVKYIECSAYNGKNLNMIGDSIMELYNIKPSCKKSLCIIL
jgi:small GTP-binding protein